MKNFRSKNGPTSERPFYELKEIEEICNSELTKSGFLPSNPEPIRIDRFIETRFGISPRYEELPEGLLGYTKFGRSGAEEMVITNALDEEGTIPANRRVRSTLAHEAGHALLHAHLFVLAGSSGKLFDNTHDDTPRVLCRDINGQSIERKGYDGKWWEYQANRAMGALLMPRSLVQTALHPFLESKGIFEKPNLVQREEAIKALADIFDVNPAVVRIRLEDIYPLTESRQPSLA